MKFNPLNVPTHWQHYWTRFPEGHTILEALISWVSQVDDMVDNQNNLNTTVENYGERLDSFIDQFDTELQTTVQETLSQWQTSGFLEVVISEALQWELDDFKAATEEKILTSDKNIVFMADSYGTYDKDSTHYSWTENVIATLGLTDHAINLSQGSRGFAYNPAVGTFQTGLQNAVISGTIPQPEKIKRIIICGGTNDVVGIALRHITEEDVKTGIQDFMTYAKATFPNAVISVGFNGNCNVGSYETPYYKALNAYKTVAKYGGSFMKNLEYVLRRPNLLDDSGLHPSATGFSLLYEKTNDCILNGSCNVSVDLTNVDFTPDLSRGTWNVTPALHFTQSDNIVGLISSRNGLMYTLTTPATFNDLVGDGTFGGFKLIRLGKMNNTPLRGGHIDGNNGNKYKVLGYIRHRVRTNNGNPLVGTVPLVMCGYDLYVGVADNADNASWVYQAPSNKTFTGLDPGLTITGIYFDSFKIDVDIGSLDYIN